MLQSICMLSGLLAWASTTQAADYAGAFLELGIGARGPGLGGAYAAAVTGPEAAYWNPAGLIRTTGIRVNTSIRPMSLDRLHNSMATSVNMRGDMAFGFAWVHAGVDGIQGRTGTGVPTGRIDDAEDAFLVSVARALGQRAAVGLSLKVLNQDVGVPGWNKANATGHGFDAGLQVRAAEGLYLAAAVRNIDATLDWKVARSSTQASSTSDDLRQTALVGVAIRPTSPLLVTGELARADGTFASMGVEWMYNDLLTVRGGVRRFAGDGSSSPTWSAGLSLRPMRTDALLFHYAFVTDRLEAGDRSVFGISMSF